MFGLFKKKTTGGIGHEVGAKVANLSGRLSANRINELEEKFDALCDHLKVRIHSNRGYRVVERKAPDGASDTCQKTCE